MMMIPCGLVMLILWTGDADLISTIKYKSPYE
jgi:hypothetical protein